MPVNLDFNGAYTPPSGDNVNLNFGANTPVSITANIAITLPPIVVAIAATHDVNVLRGPNIFTRFVYESAALASGTPRVGWNNKPPATLNYALPWESASVLTSGFSLAWDKFFQLANDYRLVWGSGERREGSPNIVWQASLPVSVSSRFVWEAGEYRQNTTAITWQSSIPIEKVVQFQYLPGIFRADQTTLPWDHPRYATYNDRLVWDDAVQPGSGTHPVSPPPPVDPPFSGDSDLDFICLWHGNEYKLLNFGSTCQGFPAPPTGTIMGTNNATLIRVSDSIPVPFYQATVSLDIESWAWGFSAVLPNNAALALVKPPIGGTPIEVRLTVNGYSWLLQVSSYTRSRTFGQQTWTIKGESVSAQLSSPYTTPDSRVETTLRLANQIAEDEIATTGYTLTWNLVDWLIPANIYNYQNLTPIDAMLLVIRAAGGVLQTDRNSKSFTALPRYTYKPWEWASQVPAYTLHENLVRNLGVEWNPRPRYNGVFVTARDSGVSVSAKITGTAGNILAPMVVDPLISTAAVGSERARQILSDTRDFEIYTFETPLNSFVGAPVLMENGKLVQVTESSQTWIGEIVATEIRVDRGRTEPLKVAQVLKVERFLGPNP